MNERFSSVPWRQVWITGLILLLFVITLRMMGREFFSDSGFGLWTGAWTEHTSQWVADPYSLSHILHGIFFFWLLLPFRVHLSLATRFVIATIIEVAWEIVENTPFIINRYRDATASLDYYGDSILNSFFDVVFMMAGFWMAYRLGWKLTLVIVVIIELAMLVTIRDNLTLNVLMLLYPIDAIREWQMSA